jgi:hypothetical protein
MPPEQIHSAQAAGSAEQAADAPPAPAGVLDAASLAALLQQGQLALVKQLTQPLLAQVSCAGAGKRTATEACQQR